MIQIAVGIEIDARVVPGAGFHRGDVEAFLVVFKWVLVTVQTGAGKVVEDLRIEPIHPAKTAELALTAIVETVMVLIRGD